MILLSRVFTPLKAEEVFSAQEIKLDQFARCSFLFFWGRAKEIYLLAKFQVSYLELLYQFVQQIFSNACELRLCDSYCKFAILF